MESKLATGAIGIFDSGYGGLTVLEGIRKELPNYDYIYLGDNARAPYGVRSFEIVYRFTLQAVQHLFDLGCPLVILGCNTASAKALRTIQQNDLPMMTDPTRRVLGVIRPTVERLGEISHTGHIGVLGTPGTIASQSYDIEVAKLYPDFIVTGHACPMWVPLVENRESLSAGADYFVKQEIERLFDADPKIDTVVLGCTHYPLLLDKINKYLPKGVSLVLQGEITGTSLSDYLRRHPEMERRISRGGTCRYLTTEKAERFSDMASIFLSTDVKAEQTQIP